MEAAAFADVAAAGNVSHVSSCVSSYSSISDMAAGRVGSAAVGNFSDSAGAGIACESVAGIFADARSS